MRQEVKIVQEYIAILKRYKFYMLAIVTVGLILSAIVALKSPSMYKSTATILIDKQEVPQELVTSIVTNYAEQRIQIINKKIMSSKNLINVINKFNMYQEEQKGGSIYSIVEKMRGDIEMDIIGGDPVINPRTGKPTEPTLAFTLSFVSKSPEIAQKVVNELVSLYLNENINQRFKAVDGTTKFLTQEAIKLRKEVSILENDLATFKEKNASNLPAMNQVNLSRIERIELQIAELDTQVSSSTEKEFYLKSQLEQLIPNSNNIGNEQLVTLKSEYLKLSSKYSKEHPDVKKLKREIANLEKSIEQQPATVGSELIQTQVNNPVYVQLKGQIISTQAQLRESRRSRDTLREKLSVYEERFAKAPRVEREFESLMRDYQNVITKYREVRAKKRQASLAQSMELEKKGDEFTLLEPPLLPEKHYKPNRPAIMFLGLLGSIALAFGFVLVKESLKPLIYTANRLTSVAGMPPLATIPYVQRGHGMINKQKTLAFIIGGLLVVAVSWYVMSVNGYLSNQSPQVYHPRVETNSLS